MILRVNFVVMETEVNRRVLRLRDLNRWYPDYYEECHTFIRKRGRNGWRKLLYPGERRMWRSWKYNRLTRWK